jgi:hypothetical protein
MLTARTAMMPRVSAIERESLSWVDHTRQLFLAGFVPCVTPLQGTLDASPVPWPPAGSAYGMATCATG